MTKNNSTGKGARRCPCHRRFLHLTGVRTPPAPRFVLWGGTVDAKEVDKGPHHKSQSKREERNKKDSRKTQEEGKTKKDKEKGEGEEREIKKEST